MKIIPIKNADRISYLDILRGIAILFIFIANGYSFSGWLGTPSYIKSQLDYPTLNSIIKQFTVIFIDGKWYSVFSILFGIGFIIQYENIKAKNKSFNRFFTRRMCGLLLFGLLHLFLLWLGDILAIYALLGFILIFFKNHPNKQLLVIASILLVLPVIHLLLMEAFDAYYPSYLLGNFFNWLSFNNLPLPLTDGNVDEFKFVKTWLDGTSWKDLLIINLGMPLLRLHDTLLEGRYFKVLACFLLGIWAGRKILHENLLENNSLLKKILFYGLLLGIPMNILMAFAKIQTGFNWQVIAFTSYALGVVPLACAYAALIAILSSSRPKWLQHFAPVGRMALSNYIFQTVISILIFYGIGLGLALDLELWQIILIPIIIFIFQIFFSKFWLRHFKFGPLEWLWRMMTYQKYISLKK